MAEPLIDSISMGRSGAVILLLFLLVGILLVFLWSGKVTTGRDTVVTFALAVILIGWIAPAAKSAFAIPQRNKQSGAEGRDGQHTNEPQAGTTQAPKEDEPPV